MSEVYARIAKECGMPLLADVWGSNSHERFDATLENANRVFTSVAHDHQDTGYVIYLSCCDSNSDFLSGLFDSGFKQTIVHQQNIIILDIVGIADMIRPSRSIHFDQWLLFQDLIRVHESGAWTDMNMLQHDVVVCNM